MLPRSACLLFVLAGVLNAVTAGAQKSDVQRYPDWSGQWQRTGGVQWDPTKPLGRGNQPPLNPEYQAIFEAGLADQAAGGHGNDTNYLCLPGGMPRAMTVV